MRKFVDQYWLALIPIVMLIGIVATLLLNASRTEEGIPVYPLDDTYIHMTMAQNFADKGSWSLSGEGVQGASSSPLWTLLLSATFALNCPRQWAPLVLNIFFGLSSILVVFYAAHRRGWPNYLMLLVSVGIVLWSPLFTNVMVGMEQSAHVLLMLLLFTFAGEFLAVGTQEHPPRIPWKLMVLAPLATSVRYESAFLIFVICVVLAIQRRWIAGILTAVTGACPILGYAFFSTQHGGMAAPTSVLVKGVGMSSTVARIAKFTLLFGFVRLAQCPYMIALMLCAIVSYFIYRRGLQQHAGTQLDQNAKTVSQVNDAGYLFAIWLAADWLFLNATVGDSFFRYDAYLIAMGLFTLAALWANRLPRKLDLAQLRLIGKSIPRIAMACLLTTMAGILSWRAALGAINTPVASQNIQEQQYQMARFLRDYYPGQAVAINDIGAISYFAHSKIIDIWGLASTKVAKEILKQAYNSEAMERICREEDVRLAVVYTSWIERYGGIPKSWVKIGSWTIPNNYICGDSTVTFYAVDPQEVALLRAHLLAFEPKLPRDVKVELVPEQLTSANN